MWHALFANGTIPYHPHETCVEPNVDHVMACIWHWFYTKCHGLIGKFVGYI